MASVIVLLIQQSICAELGQKIVHNVNRAMYSFLSIELEDSAVPGPPLCLYILAVALITSITYHSTYRTITS